MPKVKTNKITTSRSSSDKRKTKKSPSKPKSLDKTKLAKKVFEKISHYDLMIYNYLNKTDKELKNSLPNSLNILE